MKKQISSDRIKLVFEAINYLKNKMELLCEQMEYTLWRLHWISD